MLKRIGWLTDLKWWRRGNIKVPFYVALFSWN
jgi:hypothetical protein